MRFRYIHSQDLPVMAWCAQVKKGTSEIDVFHGSRVEVRADAFVEGAWDDDFDGFEFLNAIVMCGTGGRVADSEVRFTGSTDRLNPLFSINTPRVLHVSNSLLFALTAAGEEPDPIYPFYGYDLVRIWRQGLDCPHGTFPLLSGNQLGLHFGVTLRVSTQGHMEFELRDPGEIPKDFEHYRSNLYDRVKCVITNAHAPSRNFQYRPLAAISRGYDSIATAALAGGGGCQEAVTLLDSRESDPSVDNGSENARRLGMECREVDRWSYLSSDTTTIAELSMFGFGCPTPLAGFEDMLRSRIFVTGHFGDTIWDPVKAAVCHNLSQTWSRHASGLGTSEFRLRVGYLSFAPTIIMARHNEAIHGITHSPSMESWHVPGAYNRPIARRIIEEAGIPRGAFATNKRGGGHSNFNAAPKYQYPAVEDYREFLRQFHGEISAMRTAAWKARVGLEFYMWRKLGVNKKRPMPSTPMQRRFPFLLNSPPIKMTWPSMFTLQWAYARVASRYQLSNVRA